MKWLIVLSFSGAALAVAAFVLSLVLGPAMPLSPLAMASALVPVVLIGFFALRGTSHDSTYRTLHRFSTAAKRLLLLDILLGLAGAVAIVSAISDMPSRGRLSSPLPLSAAEHYATLVAPFRATAGAVLLAYAVVGVLILIRIHYRPPIVRR
jgi:hypothetical protein